MTERSLITVCDYANRGRSPILAEALRQEATKRRIGYLEVISRGAMGLDGRAIMPGQFGISPYSDTYLEFLNNLGINLYGCIPQQIKKEDINSSNIVLASDLEVKIILNGSFPRESDKITTAISYANGGNLTNPEEENIEDPCLPAGETYFGLPKDSLAAYGVLVQQMKGLSHYILNRFLGGKNE